jgi:hypothetical protein
MLALSRAITGRAYAGFTIIRAIVCHESSLITRIVAPVVVIGHISPILRSAT